MRHRTEGLLTASLPFPMETHFGSWRFPVKMPLVASTGPVLVRCCQHRPSTGPVLAHTGMFTGVLLFYIPVPVLEAVVPVEVIEPVM